MSATSTAQQGGMTQQGFLLQQQQLQAQNIFRQKQLLAQQQHHILQQQKMQQQPQESPAPSKVVMATSNSLVVPRNQTSGQAVLRLLQFAEQLSPGQEKAVNRLYWDNLIQDFFTNQSTMKMGLYNIETNEQKAYEVNQSLQARFFHTQYMCGIISIQMTLEKTMEYILPGGIMNVECPRASLIHKFDNGSMVISTGHLWVQFSLTIQGIWKIVHLDFTFQGHEEYINRVNIPTKKKQQQQPLVNKWGIPPRVFHILEIADIAAPRMSDIVFHSLISGSNPRDCLNIIAFDKHSSIHDGHLPPIVKTQQTGFLSSSPKSPVSRKRNSTDIKSSPVARKKNNASTPRK